MPTSGFPVGSHPLERTPIDGALLRQGRRLLLACSLAAVALAPGTALAQADDPPAAVLPPATQALIAEIDAYGDGDQSRDPEGDLVKLADLARRVDADGKVPALDRGLLASAFGAAHFYAKRYDRAAEYYGEAARLFEEGNAPPEETAGLLNNRATILASTGRFDEAEASHLKALAIRRSIEGERGAMVASSLFGLGYVYYRQGRVEESIPYFRDSVEQMLEFVGPGDPNSVVRMTSLASVLSRAGREAESLEVARRAEALGREFLGDEHPTYAIALNNLGTSLIENGAFHEALPVLRETLRVRRATVGENASGTGISLRNLATALKATGNFAEAEELNRRAIAIFEASGESDTPDALPYMYADLADLALRRGGWEEYLPLAQRSLAEADARLKDDDPNRAQVHLYHAERLLRNGEPASALAEAERWVPVLQSGLIPSHKDRIWGELLLARLRGTAGRPDWTLADDAADRLELKLSDIATSDRQLARESKSSSEAALLLFEMALAAGDTSRAFRAVQLAAISELALGRQFGANAATDPALAARAEFLGLARRADELATRQAAAREGPDAALTERLGGELEEARRARDAARDALLRDYPDFVARYRPRPASLQSLQASLADGEIMLAPLEGERTGYSVRITATGFAASELDVSAMRAEVAALRAAVDGTGSDQGFPMTAAHALFARLLPDGLAQGSHVTLAGGGTLASLPLTLLLTEAYDGPLAKAPWLVRRASFEVVGNLALRAARGRVGATEARATTFAGIGGPDVPPGQAAPVALAGLFRSGQPSAESIADLPPLPGARRELEAIARALPGRDILFVGEDASEEALKKADLGQARVIAFATHGLVAGELRDLWEPALLVGTAPGSGEDGLLGASEIARLKLDADWVILSACNTAAGDGTFGPAYSGLAAAFAQAGARALMLSHWRVRDDAAARLTVETVKGAAGGLTRAEALRRAQLALMADAGVEGAAHPALWAPFVVIAD